MFKSCIRKQKLIKEQFSLCKTSEEKFSKIISLGVSRPSLEEKDKTPKNLVPGCQSRTYLRTFFDIKTGFFCFTVDSDALISNGLGAILSDVYSGENIESILKCKPTYLEELGIPSLLSPSRANGLMSIFKKMQKDALLLYHKNLKSSDIQ